MPVFSRVCPIIYPLLLSHLVFSLLHAKKKTCEQERSGSMSHFLSLQDGLHDLCVEFLPNASSYIRRLQRCMRVLSCESEVRQVSLYFSSSNFARHCCWHRNQQSKYRAIFQRYQALVSRQYIVVFFSLRCCPTSFPYLWATSSQAWMLFVSLSIAPRTKKNSLPKGDTCESSPTNLIDLGLRRYSNERLCDSNITSKVVPVVLVYVDVS